MNQPCKTTSLPTSFRSTSTETKRGCKLALEENDLVFRYSLKFRDKLLGRLTAVEYFQFSISITAFAAGVCLFLSHRDSEALYILGTELE